MDPQTINPLQAGGEALPSIDFARGMLLNAPPEQKPQTPPDEPPKAPPAEPAPAEQAEVAADEARDDTQADESEAEGEPLAPLDPPAHWKKAAKELFASLPREMQEHIVEREGERTREIDAARREAAEKRKSAESELSQYQTERQRYAQQLTTFVPLLQQQLQGKWGQVDWVKLARENPTEYVALQAELNQDLARFQQAQAEQQRLAEQQASERDKAIQDHKRQQIQKLVEMVPEWRDVARGQKEMTEIHEYLMENGVEPERLDRLVNAVDYVIARKAMLYDRAQKAKAAAVTKSVPKVQPPGTTVGKAQKAQEARAAKLQQLERTGSIDDARGLLRI